MMFKSIFTRLLATYLLLTLLITGSLALLLSYGFNRYIFNEKNRVLSAAALKVESTINSYYQGHLNQDELQTALDNLGFITDSTIYALKMDKAHLYNVPSQKLEAELAEEYLINDLQSILDGGTIYRKKQFSKALDTDVAFMGTPLKVDEQIIGAVLIFSPLSEINTYLAKINAVIGGTALAAFIISFFFIYITAFRISRPIREMGLTARKLASGEAPPDLSFHTGDEIEELANSFNYMKKQVEATEHMRQEFIANISHELRTPLTSINGFVQAILDGLIQPAQYAKYLGLVQDETRRLMHLTGDILELAKIQSGNITLSKQLFPPAKMIEQIVSQFNLPADTPKLNISIDCDAQLQVLADPVRLRQILHNLIGNAIHHMGLNGSVVVQVQAEEDRVVFAIRDTGEGISPEDLPWIFERFYQGSNTGQGHEGTGLGLSIVKNLVKMQGGFICAESRLGEGTTFIFSLPLA